MTREDFNLCMLKSDLNKYVSVEDLKALVSDLQENLDFLSNQTPRVSNDINQIKQKLETLENKLNNNNDNKSRSVFDVEDDTKFEKDLEKSDSKIPKLVISKKQK